jgi:hypothetical protein
MEPCDRSRKVAGSMSDESIPFILTDGIMALVSTQPLPERSTRNLPGSKGRPARKADNLTATWEPRCLTALRASTAC